jgi:hypothetical protein
MHALKHHSPSGIDELEYILSSHAADFVNANSGKGAAPVTPDDFRPWAVKPKADPGGRLLAAVKAYGAIINNGQ